MEMKEIAKKTSKGMKTKEPRNKTCAMKATKTMKKRG